MDSFSHFDPTLEEMITQNDFEEEFSDQLRCLARNDPFLIELDISRNRIGYTTSTFIQFYPH